MNIMKWININERLPENSFDTVLMAYGDRVISGTIYPENYGTNDFHVCMDSNGHWRDLCEKWMPAPNTYSEGYDVPFDVKFAAQQIHWNLCVKAMNIIGKVDQETKISELKEYPEIKKLWDAADVLKELYNLE